MYAQFLGTINHAWAMPPESGTERNGGESLFARPERGPSLRTLCHLAMANCAAALGKDALANQGRSSWLEVPQTRKEKSARRTSWNSLLSRKNQSLILYFQETNR
jgi:hypothetical protein